MKMISWALFELFRFKDFVLSVQITHFRKLIKNNRKSAKMILIFWRHWNQLAKMYPNLKGCLNRTNGLVFMAQTLSGSFHSEKRKFWRIYNLNPPKLPKPPLLLVKTNTWNLGHKNQTVCPIKTPFEIRIQYWEPVSMTPKKLKLFWRIFCYF